MSSLLYKSRLKLFGPLVTMGVTITSALSTLALGSSLAAAMRRPMLVPVTAVRGSPRLTLVTAMARTCVAMLVARRRTVLLGSAMLAVFHVSPLSLEMSTPPILAFLS